MSRIPRCLAALLLGLLLCAFSGCRNGGPTLPYGRSRAFRETQRQLRALLHSPGLGEETRYAIINRLANNMLAVKSYPALVLFLTDWVESHPQDPYNAYWLLMVAYSYLESDAEPLAKYYLERVLRNYNDLIVQGRSVHLLCLRHLIQLSDHPADRIMYFNQLIARFPDKVNTTELYVRIALEYEKEGEWEQALRAFQQFLNQDDAATIQIADLPNAYNMAKRLIDFNNSSKDWTFESLDALLAAVKRALATSNGRALDSYKSKVNFFATSWRQDETSPNAQSSISLRSYIAGRRIRFSDAIDESSSPTEAYLRTWGWSSVYIDVWYLYFRKVNFPADPDIHGRWEWAGIYYGEKL